MSWFSLRRQPQPYHYQPRLEVLEGRALPSTLTVTNTDDSGMGSLRGEIAAAASGDTIEFAGPVHGQTIKLNFLSGPLDLNKNLDIEGPVANPVTISGNNATRVFFIESGTVVTLSGLTITHGLAFLTATQGAGNGDTITVKDISLGGAGIANFGTLTVSHCTISDNTFNVTLTQGAGNGDTITVQDIGGDAGISNLGTLTVSHCTISDNTLKVTVTQGVGNSDTVTVQDLGGGGIFNSGTLTLDHSTISDNTLNVTVTHGTGNGDTVTVQDLGGGGIFNDTGATLNLNHSSVTGNTPDDIFP
jgi:hypothetical protein